MTARPELLEAMLADAEFLAWLEKDFGPDWRLEYSGDLVWVHAAWLAGREAQRAEDHANSDHE